MGERVSVGGRWEVGELLTCTAIRSHLSSSNWRLGQA